MRIRELFDIYRPLFSIELFPPKTPKGVDALKAKLWEIRTFAPEYISVTYGAGGSTRQGTLDVCSYIRNRLGLQVAAHLTCVAHTHAEVGTLLTQLKAAGIENVVALRGDPPQGQPGFTPPPGGFRHAIELVREIRAHDNFCIAVAGYPEGHPEAPDLDTDLRFLVEKANAGADFIISQFFLDNAEFLRWRERLRQAGIAVPIEAGILPALSAEQIGRFAATCGAKVPRALLAGLERFGDDRAGSAAFGLDFALRQIEGLLAEDIDGIHLYALNRVEAIRSVEPLLRGRQRIVSGEPL
ncbi:MAG: methylenetetrahydrofolate reductase [NAD(P)H] [Candidatus Lambdaproteobacteria bacterium]|nr:methylenetetrahydrofolate reductase [NAD(P)H] [Candidatus Lambdaproteobacteria bacterium]